jgi:hypothetical protein
MPDQMNTPPIPPTTWTLNLSSVWGKADEYQTVARAASREALIAWESSQRVATYFDGRHRRYPKHSPLYEFNPPGTQEYPYFLNIGSEQRDIDAAVAQVRHKWSRIAALFEVKS